MKPKSGLYTVSPAEGWGGKRGALLLCIRASQIGERRTATEAAAPNHNHCESKKQNYSWLQSLTGRPLSRRV